MQHFWVGQKVICIDDEPSGKYCNPSLTYWEDMSIEIVKGCVYTIRHLATDLLPTASGPTYPGLNIYVEEVIRPLGRGNVECPFSAHRFRPLIETDISDLEALLQTKDESELVDG